MSSSKKEKKTKNVKRGITLNYAYIAIIIILAAILLFQNIGGGNASSVVSEKVANEKAQTLLYNLLQGRATAEVVSVNKNDGVFEITYKINGQEQPKAYMTLDGEQFFPYVIPTDVESTTPDNNSQEEEQQDETQDKAQQEVLKVDKPKVELFIMSYCPFGLQMQKAILPVMELLGDKADISIKWVDYAMHGKKEIDENLRQYCIQKDQKDKYIDYAKCFVASGDADKCLNETNIDIDMLSSCENETDNEFKIYELYEDQTTWAGGRYPQFNIYKDLNSEYGVRGSPTFILNGEQVSVSRSSEAIKNVICDTFKERPEECDTTLNSNQEQPGIGEIGSGQTASAGTANCGS